MKLTNTGTIDRETLPWLSVPLNRQLQSRAPPPPSIRLPSPHAFVNLCRLPVVQIRERWDETRCDATLDIDAKAETWNMLQHRWKKLRYARILLWQVIDPLPVPTDFRISARIKPEMAENVIPIPIFLIGGQSHNWLQYFSYYLYIIMIMIIYSNFHILVYSHTIKINLTFYIYLKCHEN